MPIPLRSATSDHGAKAASLGALLRAGLPVPDGIVVLPNESTFPEPDYLSAVRSSASTEDLPDHSGAGQFHTELNVHPSAIPDAISKCRESLTDPEAFMCVIIQPMVPADVAGVMFHGNTIHLEAFSGLGTSVVGGTVTPDTFAVTGNHIEGTNKQLLPDAHLLHLASLSRDISGLLGGPQDIEWAIADERIYILQARPITRSLPQATTPDSGATLIGSPGSAGTITATARILESPTDAHRLSRGEILVCRFTDPAWTPLFRAAGGIVTETGGALSHAAIVAREHGIPAVIGACGATSTITDGALITINGNAGTVHT